jgi:hypothetical protein
VLSGETRETDCYPSGAASNPFRKFFKITYWLNRLFGIGSPGGVQDTPSLQDLGLAALARTFQTYRKPNPKPGGAPYNGRTSGYRTPEENVAARDRNHHMNDKGFGKAELDKTSSDPDAIRGREKQLIDESGGAQSQGGTSANAINGLSPTNPNADGYKAAAEAEFEEGKAQVQAGAAPQPPPVFEPYGDEPE